jgi:hypothetical protein
MKTFDQLAQSAYAAYAKQIQRPVEVPAWSKLPHETKQAWEAAAKQLWAEFAAMH